MNFYSNVDDCRFRFRRRRGHTGGFEDVSDAGRVRYQRTDSGYRTKYFGRIGSASDTDRHDCRANCRDSGGFQIRAYKIGMLGTAEIIECVAEQTAECDFGKRVLDPVMIAKGGAPLLENSAVEAMKRLLLPHTDVLTPNLPEAQALTGINIENRQDAERAAKILQDWGVKNVVIKGGHLADSQSEYCTDWLFTPYETIELNSKRFPTPHTHGTGCTFSACITAELAKGLAYRGGSNGKKLYCRRHFPSFGHRGRARAGQPLGVSGRIMRLGRL